ncbi:MAG: hypothetical protein ABIP07_00115 [Sphingomicrobium sp.]
MQKTPLGNEVLDFNPFSLPPHYLRAIGLMSAAASSTDGVFEMAIAGVLGVDGEMGWAVTAHMTAPLRKSVLSSAAEIRFESAKTLDRLDAVLSRIKTAVEERNDMIHGSWCIKHSTGEVLLVQQEARTHVVTSSRPVPVDEIERKALTLYDAGMELMHPHRLQHCSRASPRAATGGEHSQGAQGCSKEGGSVNPPRILNGLAR